MSMFAVVDEIERAPALSELGFGELAEKDESLRVGLRVIERNTAARTLGDVALYLPEIEDVMEGVFRRNERREFFRAMLGAVRRLARERTPAPPPAAPAAAAAVPDDDIPRGGDELDAWAERHGVGDMLEEYVRVVANERARSGSMFPLRHMVDLVLFPQAGDKHGIPRGVLRAMGVDVLRPAVKKTEPLVAARAAFLARCSPPEDAWLASRVAILEKARQRAQREAQLMGSSIPIKYRYPCAAVRFEPRPPSLLVDVEGSGVHAGVVVSLTDGQVSVHVYSRLARAMQQLAVLECAIDALSDPEGEAVAAALSWRKMPAHEHLLADLRRNLDARSVLAPRAHAGEEEKIAFRIAENGTDMMQVVMRRPKKNGGLTAGRKVPIGEALALPALTPIEREILELALLVEHARYTRADPYRAKLRLFDLLSEHPEVHLDDAAKTPVRVRRTRATLRVTPEGGRFRAEVVLGAIVPDLQEHTLRQSRLVVAIDARAGLVHYADLDDATIALVSALRDHDEPLETEGLDALLGTLATIPNLGLELSLPEEARGKPVAADEKLVAQLSMGAGGTLALALRVRPLPRGPALVPGATPRHAYGATDDGQRVFATRDLDTEEASAERLLAELPLAGAERRGPYDLRIEDPERACDLVASLAELANAGAVVTEWAEGDQLRVAKTLGPNSLRVRIERRHDWFAVDGDAEVGGAKVGLRALLDAVRAGRRFVRLGNGELAAIGRDLRARLRRADDVLLDAKGGLAAHPPALAAVSGLVEDDEQLTAAKEWIDLRARVRSASAIEPELPTGLKAQLRPYQLDGFRWLARLAACGSGGCLADDMGLGKTLQSLAVLLARKDDGPALVVAPTSVCANWQAEAERFSPGLEVVPYRGADRRARLEWIGTGTVLVASYDVMLRDADELAGIRFATAIFDEAHFLKNANAKRAAAARRIVADVRFALTGTPVENHLGELFSLFRVIVPGLFGSWERFRERFAAPIERDRDPARSAALAAVVRPYLLRRTKSEVSPELPPRTEVVRFVTLSPAERELYEAERQRAIASMRETAAEGEGSDGRFAILASLTRLRQLACHPRLRDAGSSVRSTKLASVLDLVEELRDAGHRALVFSQFTSHLALLSEALRERGISFLELDGGTPAEARADRVRRFQAGEAMLFLISLKAGGTGLNLTAADYVLHLDPWWNPAAEDQASDRAHRIGQDKPVTVVRFITRGTIEETVLSLHEEKRELASAVLTGGDVAARLSTRELFALMEKSATDEATGESDERAGDDDAG